MTVLARTRTLVAAALVAALACLGTGSAVAAQGDAHDRVLPGVSRAAAQPTPATPTVDPLCTLKRLHFQFSDPLKDGFDHQVAEQYLPTDDGSTPRKGMSAVMPATPQHPEVHFLGWYYATKQGEAGSVPFDPQHPRAQSYNTTADQTTTVPVVAKYDDTHSVVFHNHTGSQDIVEGALRVPDALPIEEPGSDRRAPHAKAASSGRYLDGWGKEQNGTKKWNLETERVHGPLQLYAHFIDGRIVTFDTAGGSFVPVHVIGKQEQFDPDDSRHAERPTRPGYEFKYWSLSAAGQKQAQFHKADTPTGGKDFTLHAVWQPVRTPYALVYMREVVPQGIPGRDYEPKYVVDSVATSRALTDSDAPVVEKTIQEPSEVRDGKQTYVTFILNRTRTEKAAVKVKGDGTTVRYVYYDRPRHDLTYQAQISPDDLWYTNPGNPFPGGSAAADNKWIRKTFHNVIAGGSEKPYYDEFLKEWRQAIAASPKAMTAWKSRAHSDNPQDYKILFREDPPSYTYFIYPPYMPPRDVSLQGRYIGDVPIAYNYVEVDPDQPGILPGGKYAGGTWHPDQPLAGARILNPYRDGNYKPVRPGEFWPGRVSITGVSSVQPSDEDFLPVRGFKTIDNSDHYYAAADDHPSRSALIDYGSHPKEYNFFLRYVRLKYPLDLRANGGPDGDKKTKVPYDDPLGGKLPYTIDKTVRTSDQAVFKGWYRDPKFTGEPIDAVHESMPYHGLVLYAKWEVPKVVVNYHDWDPKHPKNGHLFHSEQHDKYKTLDTLHAPNKVDGIDESEFQGWRRYNRQGYLVPVATGMKLVKDTYDLYPAWPLQDVGLVYHHGGGTGSVPDTHGQRYRPNRNAIIQAAPQLVPPAGKVLLGWRVRGAVNQQVYKPGDLFALEPVGENNSVHLDPVWGPAAPKATITYHPNGGDGQDVTVEYPAWAKEDYSHHARPNYTRKDYALRGWGRKGQPADAPVIECENQGPVYLPPGGSHLYALWDVSNVTVHIRKVDEQGQPLRGAQFKLYYDRDMRQPVQDAPVQVAGDGSSFVALSVPTSSVDSNSITYWLAETKAPPGHELMPVPVGFTLRKVPTISMSLVEPDTVPNVKLEGTTLTIENVPAGHLPAAGGAGHVPYYIAGLVLLAGAALIGRRRSQRS